MERAEQDAAAYAALNEVLRLKSDDEKRRRELPSAVSKAIEPPLEILRLSGETLALLDELRSKTNAMLDSDLAIAAILADAAAQSAAWNIRINLPLMNDAEDAAQLKQQVAQQLEKASRFSGRIEQHCQSKA
jgi:formiminotetrahydrofolate cyclodeaminase